MIRKCGFSFVLLSAVVVAACGKQVTPNPPNVGPGGLPPGYTSVKFDVAAPFNFSNYRYIVVFNTTENGLTPLTKPWQNNWAAYSYSIEVGGNEAGTFASVNVYQRSLGCPPNCSQPPAYIHIGTTPTQFQYQPNSNGSGTEFTIIFQPLIFTAFASPSPSPGSSATPPPVKPIWTFNAFTAEPNVDAQLVFQDSLGTYGPTDQTFVSPNLNISQSCGFDQVIFAGYDSYQMDQAARIISVEIANNPALPKPPATPAPCSGS
jgi:hypothetical protein